MDPEILPLIDFTKVKKKKIIKTPVQPPETGTQPNPSVPSAHPEQAQPKSEDLSNVFLEKKKQPEAQQASQEENQKTVHFNDIYSYDFLLDRIYKMIQSPERSLLKIPIPELNPAGKRSVWVNFSSFETALNRPLEHLLHFVMEELGVEGTINAEKQALLKSRVARNQIESILRKYIQDFVQCKNCKSFKTTIIKDQSTRLQQLSCESCKAILTLQNAKSLTKAGRK